MTMSSEPTNQDSELDPDSIRLLAELLQPSDPNSTGAGPLQYPSVSTPARSLVTTAQGLLHSDFNTQGVLSVRQNMGSLYQPVVVSRSISSAGQNWNDCSVRAPAQQNICDTLSGSSLFTQSGQSFFTDPVSDCLYTSSNAEMQTSTITAVPTTYSSSEISIPELINSAGLNTTTDELSNELWEFLINQAGSECQSSETELQTVSSDVSNVVSNQNVQDSANFSDSLEHNAIADLIYGSNLSSMTSSNVSAAHGRSGIAGSVSRTGTIGTQGTLETLPVYTHTSDNLIYSDTFLSSHTFYSAPEYITFRESSPQLLLLQAAQAVRSSEIFSQSLTPYLSSISDVRDVNSDESDTVFTTSNLLHRSDTYPVNLPGSPLLKDQRSSEALDIRSQGTIILRGQGASRGRGVPRGRSISGNLSRRRAGSTATYTIPLSPLVDEVGRVGGGSNVHATKRKISDKTSAPKRTRSESFVLNPTPHTAGLALLSSDLMYHPEEATGSSRFGLVSSSSRLSSASSSHTQSRAPSVDLGDAILESPLSSSTMTSYGEDESSNEDQSTEIIQDQSSVQERGRRGSRGRDMSKLSAAEAARLEKRRDQNRRAARGSRQRKKEHSEQIKKDYQVEQSRNTDLQQEIRTLNRERYRLVQVLADHTESCDNLREEDVEILEKNRQLTQSLSLKTSNETRDTEDVD